MNDLIAFNFPKLYLANNLHVGQNRIALKANQLKHVLKQLFEIFFMSYNLILSSKIKNESSHNS